MLGQFTVCKMKTAKPSMHNLACVGFNAGGTRNAIYLSAQINIATEVLKEACLLDLLRVWMMKTVARALLCVCLHRRRQFVVPEPGELQNQHLFLKTVHPTAGFSVTR